MALIVAEECWMKFRMWSIAVIITAVSRTKIDPFHCWDSSLLFQIEY